MSKISVIMSTYKEPIKWVSRCIDSVLNQTVKPDEYIIIVDYPENTEMIEMLKGYEEEHECIKVYVNDMNIGLVSSLNKALKYCTGDVIARMDADDYAESTRFEKQLEYMNKMQYDFVGTGYTIFYDDKVIQKREGRTNDLLCKNLLKYAASILHPTWMLKREVYDALNGYRDIDSCEDLDFLIRASRAGFKMGAVPEQLLWYRDNPNSISHEKNYKQKATRDFLCENYRRKKDTSMDEYEMYLKSNLFERRKKDYEFISNMEAKINNAKNAKLKKGIYMFRLLLNCQYIRQKFMNKGVNLISKLYA